MARPLKKGMEYFPHDVDAVDDEKIEILRKLYGNDGYAFYFIILERIYRTNTGELLIDTDLKKKILVSKVGVSMKRFDDLLKTSLEYELFSSSCYEERKSLTSNGIMKRVKQVETERERWRNNKGKHVENHEKTEENHEKTNRESELSGDNKSKYNTTEYKSNEFNNNKYPLIESLLPILSKLNKKSFTDNEIFADACETTLQKVKTLTGDVNFISEMEQQINWGNNPVTIKNSVNPVKDLNVYACQKLAYLLKGKEIEKVKAVEQEKIQKRPLTRGEQCDLDAGLAYWDEYNFFRYKKEGVRV
jgi:hypothetical protein